MLDYSDHDYQRFYPSSSKAGDERSEGEIDRSRIIHSAAFRRLHGKTQIFAIAQDSFYRNRLTHSLEVAQIAKGIAIRVEADATACEAIALAHDIGHPPFGHRGETILGELMSPFGGFEANAQNLRVLGKLEIKSVDYQGLNLTRLVLDGLLKYRLPHPGEGGKFYYTDDAEIQGMTEWAMEGSLDKTFECQIMDWADDVAYSVHDLEDGLHSGFVTSRDALRLASRILEDARRPRRQPDCTEDDVLWAIQMIVDTEDAEDVRTSHALRKQLTSSLINDFIQSASRIEVTQSHSPSPRHTFSLGVDASIRRKCQILKSLSFVLLIDNHRIASLESRARHILTSLFFFYSGTTGDRNDAAGRQIEEALTAYPEPFRTDYRNSMHSTAARARVACDFIAGMTDEYAERVFRRLFSGERVALGDY